MALIQVKKPKGTQIMRGLVDPCSQESFITEAAATRFKLKGSEIIGHITGVGQMKTRIYSKVSLTLGSTLNNFSTSCEAFVVPTITKISPTTKFNINN